MLYQKYSNIFHCKYSGYTHKENMHIKWAVSGVIKSTFGFGPKNHTNSLVGPFVNVQKQLMNKAHQKSIWANHHKFELEQGNGAHKNTSSIHFDLFS
jgi:hypothetical protein